ncbi:MAG TPA: peptidoglycan DD-metalloendopeptidase family protein [Sphingomicrobium sp.]|nr:peptidoglycan DD-metalloendopeptidase family protein [Sphingomicrobium sp.]
MRRLAFLLLAAPLLLAASALVQPAAESVDEALKRARAEASAADSKVRRLEQAAGKARGEAARLHAQQSAAAEAIAAAEARISAAEAERQIIAARIAARRQRLERQQRPVASLLAGLAMMARRPPLLALTSDSSMEEFVRVRLLLDESLPVIRRRTAALSAELARGQRLERAAIASRRSLERSRDELATRRREFAALEERALRSAELSGSAALGAGDVALAMGEDIERLAEETRRNRSAAQIAAELAALGPAEPRPMPAEGRSRKPPLDYRLPARARVLEGLGEVNSSGVRSRGLTLATRRGTEVIAPAAGIVRFAGPFRDYDGIAIIDHGGGWMSLIVNLASPLTPGARVGAGEGIGRALGPLGVELSHRGRYTSPALIAGSSATLSKGAKGG